MANHSWIKCDLRKDLLRRKAFIEEAWATLQWRRTGKAPRRPGRCETLEEWQAVASWRIHGREA